MLFEPFAARKLHLANRLVMAPLTRSRAIGNQPNELMREYYTQRAGAGLLIAEGTAGVKVNTPIAVMVEEGESVSDAPVAVAAPAAAVESRGEPRPTEIEQWQI